MKNNLVKRIVVAEDEKNLRNTIAFILEEEGYHVATASNGEEAFNEILSAKEDQVPFALLITDLLMPFLNGFQLIDRLRKSKLSLPVMVIAAGTTKDTVIKLLRMGCVDYLDKPFASIELRDRVKVNLQTNNI